MRRSLLEAAGWMSALGGLLVGIVLWSATVGAADLAPADVARIVFDELGVVSYEPAESHARFIVMDLRLPRIVLGAIVGAALAGAGATMQGFFRNPMADPSIIGVSSGAAAGAVLVVTSPLSIPFGVPAAAFAGGLIAAFSVYLIATEGDRTPVATLLLAGVAVQTFLGAVVSFLLVRSDDQGMRQAIFWLLGSLAETEWREVGLVAVATAACLVVLLAFARDLNVMLFGEGDAHALGVEVERTKRILLAVSSLLTAAAVMYVGVVGFVGLIVPHGMRLLVGPDHRLLLPASALAGGAFLVLADTVSRWGAAGLPVGVVTAFVGAPFFLFLLRRREVHSL